MINSIQNPHIKLVRDLLSQSKERQQSQRFVVEGIRLYEEAHSAGWQTDFILYSEHLPDRGKELVHLAENAGAEVLEVGIDLLNRISDTKQSQGIIVVLKMRTIPEPKTLSFALIMDSIRDPGNMGSILRTAAAAGVQAIWITPDTTDPFGPKVLRAGMGAQFRLPISTLEWTEISKKARLNNLFVYLTEMTGGIPLWQADLKQPVGIIISNEANGASSMAREMCNGSVFIPMPGNTESLNASVAAGILIFETIRQRENS